MNYWFYLGVSPKKFVAEMNKQFKTAIAVDPHALGYTVTLSNEHGDHVVVIWTRFKKDLRTLVHECVHAAGSTIDHVGYRHDPANDEPFAYLIDEIFGKALNLK